MNPVFHGHVPLNSESCPSEPRILRLWPNESSIWLSWPTDTRILWSYHIESITLWLWPTLIPECYGHTPMNPRFMVMLNESWFLCSCPVDPRIFKLSDLHVNICAEPEITLVNTMLTVDHFPCISRAWTTLWICLVPKCMLLDFNWATLRTKWLSFGRDCFQMHFLKWKLLGFD